MDFVYIHSINEGWNKKGPACSPVSRHKKVQIGASLECVCLLPTKFRPFTESTRSIEIQAGKSETKLGMGVQLENSNEDHI